MSDTTLPKMHRVGVIMNGVTGRMGTNQHLIRSIVAIRKEGGVKCADGEIIMPEPVLIGRNIARLHELAKLAGLDTSVVTTDLDSALADSRNVIYFDAQTTGRRSDAVKKAIAAGKHVYCEKPTAVNTADAYDLYEVAKTAGVKHGVVQDKLWLPGLVKLQTLIHSGFFGEILSVKGDFGYWVFTGLTPVAPQRPSWNYRKEDDGGMIVDMLCHWRYIIHNLFGPIKALSCFGATHVKKRVDESGTVYNCTADDAAYATFELENGVIVQFNSSWATRVRRDDLLTIQVDGMKGSAVASLRDCVVQHESATPRPTWNPDVPSSIDHLAAWNRVPDWQTFDNAFKIQWEMFLRHVVKDEPYTYDLLEGAKGVQLTELGLESWEKRCWVNVPELTA
ncbi:oxidoreductase domain-containing protein [Naematelia encephala]|uniref:Oxidoreductase domain-containing protein n=1 Tax=Naematelia encephala TaxID=71784 RepID=A0A1Y2APS1_9TREE|nr:oxidoreductase domain-containing protein [Naematelia encephala]